MLRCCTFLDNACILHTFEHNMLALLLQFLILPHIIFDSLLGITLSPNAPTPEETQSKRDLSKKC